MTKKRSKGSSSRESRQVKKTEEESPRERTVAESTTVASEGERPACKGDVKPTPATSGAGVLERLGDPHDQSFLQAELSPGQAVVTLVVRLSNPAHPAVRRMPATFSRIEDLRFWQRRLAWYRDNYLPHDPDVAVEGVRVEALSEPPPPPSSQEPVSGRSGALRPRGPRTPPEREVRQKGGYSGPSDLPTLTALVPQLERRWRAAVAAGGKDAARAAHDELVGARRALREARKAEEATS